MAKLNNEHKVFIIQQLACYSSLTEIKEMFSNNFGIDIALQQIDFYNPETGKRPSEKLIELFYKTREEFNRDSLKIPIANKSYRLKALQKIYEKYMNKGNYVGAMEALEQVAKETGDMFVNKNKTIDEPQSLTPREILNQQFNQINQYFGMANIEDVSDPYDMDQVLLKKPNVQNK